MTRDDIIRVMCDVLGPESEFWSVNEAMLEEWLPFLQAIAAAERDACCRIVTGLCISDNNAREINEAIRGRA